MYIRLEVNVCYMCVRLLKSGVSVQIIMQFVKWSLQKKNLSIWHFFVNVDFFVDVHSITVFRNC